MDEATDPSTDTATSSDDTAPRGTDIERIDHVALVVADFDAVVRTFTDALGLRCARIGWLGRDGTRRIAMIADGTGFKLELIEAHADAVDPPSARFDHVALRAHDVDESHDRLLAEGFTAHFAPRRLEPAHARTALLREPSGIDVQIVRYDDTSPDL